MTKSLKEKETVKINLKDRIVTLRIERFDTDVDMDDILKIDYSNILGEVLTFPVLINRIGILRAEAEEIMDKKKFELEILWSELSEIYRENLNYKGSGNRSKPTEKQIENAVTKNDKYRKKKTVYFRAKRNFEYLDSLYWAAKDKSKKLDYCSGGIQPEEFEREIVEGSVNGVMIKAHEKLIKDQS